MFRPLYWAIIRSQCVSEETIQCSIYIATLYSLLWNTLRPDDGPVQGPKHVISCVLTLLPASSLLEILRRSTVQRKTWRLTKVEHLFLDEAWLYYLNTRSHLYPSAHVNFLSGHWPLILSPPISWKLCDTPERSESRRLFLYSRGFRPSGTLPWHSKTFHCNSQFAAKVCCLFSFLCVNIAAHKLTWRRWES
jgi:hypothetical protein